MNINLIETDPSFTKLMTSFSNEVSAEQQLLSKEEQALVSIVSLVTQGSSKLLNTYINEVLSDVLTAIQIKEAIYQCTPYIGFAKVVDAITVANEVFTTNDIELPLDEQETVIADTRFQKGVDAQATIFGDGMRKIASLGDNMPRENKYLASNCFGDYYTRNGLDLPTREMLTLAILTNLGTEPQIKAHIFGNMSMGKSQEYITEVAFQCLPYCGYPRLLNTLGYIKEVFTPQEEK